MAKNGKTYRVGQHLAAVLEIYLIDGLRADLDAFEEDAPAFQRAHEVALTWTGGKSLFVPDAVAADLCDAATWASNSADDDARAEEVEVRHRRGDAALLSATRAQRDAAGDFALRLSRQHHASKAVA
jgi:hypothetical protein